MSLGPYPWPTTLVTGPPCSSSTKRNREHHGDDGDRDQCAKQIKPNDVIATATGDLREDYRDCPRCAEVLHLIETDPGISLQLPLVGATAGRVLQHAANVFAKLQEKHAPMTFKFGITHNPHWRWHNELYGYRHSSDRFEHMTVVFADGNPHGPAFLEASLIREFGSAMAKCIDQT